MEKNKIILNIVLIGLLIASVSLTGCIDDGGEEENKLPTANAGIDQTVNIGDTVSFNGTGSDPDGSIVKYEWDFDGDGAYDWYSTTSGSTTHFYNTEGIYVAKLRITNNKSVTCMDTCTITAKSPVIGEAEIIDHNSYFYLGCFYVVGIVKNIGDINIESIKITATFYDLTHNVLGTSFGFAGYYSYCILPPQQKLPFKIRWQEDSIILHKYDHYTLEITYLATVNQLYDGLIIQNVTSRLSESKIYYITGEVNNTGSQSVKSVKIFAAFYNVTGKIIGVTYEYAKPPKIDVGQIAPFELRITQSDLPDTIDHFELQVQCLQQ